MKIGLKIAFALGVIVLVVTSILTYVALSNVKKLGQRLESVYTDAVLPYAQAEAINSSLDEMQRALLRAINQTGRQQQQDLDEVVKHEQEFNTLFDGYEKELTLVTQPAMQDLLTQYGALEDQMTREQNALKDVEHDYKLLKPLNDTIVDLVKNGKRDEANALYDDFWRAGPQTHGH